MARKTPEDFKDSNGEIDYQAYADYLESAECADDDDYDILVDVKSGNIYERTNGSWKEGHGHDNVFNGYKRDKDDEKSKGRDWKNPWLKDDTDFEVKAEEQEFVKKRTLVK